MNSRRGSTMSPIRRVEDLVGHIGILDLDLQQCAVFRVERGFPQLFGIHFAQTLVTLDRQALAPGSEDRLQQLGRTD